MSYQSKIKNLTFPEISETIVPGGNEDCTHDSCGRCYDYMMKAYNTQSAWHHSVNPPYDPATRMFYVSYGFNVYLSLDGGKSWTSFLVKGLSNDFEVGSPLICSDSLDHAVLGKVTVCSSQIVTGFAEIGNIVGESCISIILENKDGYEIFNSQKLSYRDAFYYSIDEDPQILEIKA